MSVATFRQGTVISRADVNTRFDQALQMFPAWISNGGTSCTTAEEARAALGAYARIVLYKNTSGATGTINLANVNVYDKLRYMGVYIGNSNIQRYVEFWIGDHANSINTSASLYYLTAAGNLLIRCGNMAYRGSQHKLYIESKGCYHFDPSGNTWVTSEDLYAYEIVGYFCW